MTKVNKYDSKDKKTKNVKRNLELPAYQIRGENTLQNVFFF